MSDPSDDQIDEILIYDSKKDEFVTKNQILVNNEDKLFLSTLNDSELVDENGFISFMKLREITDLDRSQVDYRFKKFGERYKDIVEVERFDRDETPYADAPRKARLTEKGKQLVRRGFIGSESNPHRTIVLTKEEYESLEETITELESTVEELEERVISNTSDVDDLEKWVSDLTDDIQHLYSWRNDLKPFIMGVRKSLSDSNVDLDSYIRKAKKSLKSEELSSDTTEKEK